MLMVSYLVICFTLIPKESEGARILAVFPFPSISHQVVFRPLTQELAKRGHEVTVITPDPAFPKGKTPPNLKEIDFHDISYNILEENKLKVGNKNDLTAQMEAIFQTVTSVVVEQLKDETVQDVLKNKFDLLLLEAIARPALAFSHICKTPVILVSSFGTTFVNYEMMGAPVHPMLYPDVLRQRLNNITMWEKITEMTKILVARVMHYKYNTILNNVLREHLGADFPSVQELSDNVDMLFLNVHPVFEGIRPVPPSIIYMGGLHQNPEKMLPKDLKSYLDSSKNGVIYFSFGTNVDPSLLPPEKIQIFVKVLSSLPYNVLWKWNEDELPGRTENIRISKWFPQSDLLRHPNIKLFITQGGLQSTDEAITAGVPLVGVPMLGDQWYNVEKYVYHGIGVRLDIESLTEETLKTAIFNVIEDESYRRNIINLRNLMQDQPQKPLERAVWWTEYVLRHGGAKHLRSPAANISWSEYLEIELVSVLLSVIVIVISILVLVARCLYKCLFRKTSSVKVKHN